ncbi:MULTISPECIES: TetR/AcrR family transcriptional regulator [Myxococcaceae]|uniref:TetR/AcrR family transcriptional regulator n=1 Tax=Myxococcaceae TaxID=31 RepID=UPI00188FE846|nr:MULTISPECIES: TetR/AcrR family transcriptional regulator [Myxococcaceae]MBF5043376.1 TetR/AcrR family transcriptional regulator [Simulacricoccus sp. 17bor-14]
MGTSGEERRPGRPRSEEAHQAILASAIALVREVGYDRVRMDAVARRAGVGKATVYRRWKTCEALVCEALERLVSALPVPDTGRLRDDLLRLMDGQLGLYRDEATGELLSGLVAGMARSAPLARTVREGFFAAGRAGFLLALRRGVRRGELRRGLDLELALDALQGPLFYRFLFTGAPLDRRVTRTLVDALLRAFAPPVRARAPAHG